MIPKNPHAVALGRRGGLAGKGHRHDAATKAAQVRADNYRQLITAAVDLLNAQPYPVDREHSPGFEAEQLGEVLTAQRLAHWDAQHRIWYLARRLVPRPARRRPSPSA